MGPGYETSVTNQGAGRAVLLCEVLKDIVLRLFQLPDTSYMPWLGATSL